MGAPPGIHSDNDSDHDKNDDCNDNDISLLAQTNDLDCDGVVTAIDCDDNNASINPDAEDIPEGSWKTFQREPKKKLPPCLLERKHGGNSH